MTIIADTREPDNGFDSEELDCGDYVITGQEDGIIIERKTWSDLVSSLRSGKLFLQLRMCLNQEDYRTVLLIEGSRSKAIHFANSSHSELRRFVSSMIVKMPEVYLLQTQTRDETNALIRDLDEWLTDPSDHVHRVREAQKVQPGERDRYLVEGLPKCGPKTAKKLLEHFDSAESVFTASAEELQAVPGIGPKKAREMRSALSK